VNLSSSWLFSGEAMKSLILFSILFPLSIFAQNNDVAIVKTITLAQKLDWSKPQSAKALKFKTAFEENFATFKRTDQNVLGDKFVVVMIGCGTECQQVGIIDIVTGIPVLTDINASIGVDFNTNSSYLIVNPLLDILSGYGENPPAWLKTEIYKIDDNGKFTKVSASALFEAKK
jgi:hypothetical protein